MPMKSNNDENNHKKWEPTEEERLTAARLKEIFDKKKSEYRDKGERLSQQKLGGMLNLNGKQGITQSAVGQYLNARIPLNLEAILEFARVLECDPNDISQEVPVSTHLSVSELAVLDAYRNNPNAAAAIDLMISGINQKKLGSNCQ